MRGLTAIIGLLGLTSPLVATAETASGRIETSAGPLAVVEMVAGLTEPWAFGFLPGGALLITERGGRLLRVEAGQAHPVAGLPELYVGGQGGLLDLMVPRDFAASREIWLSYSAKAEGGAATAVGRGRLSPEGTVLEGFETVWTGDAAPGGRHFGVRLVEGRDGTIFVATGDRGTGPRGQQAQNPATSIGKVIALGRDSRPLGSPSGAVPGLHSLGHRNIQGAALDAEGALWVVEHGAKGGDELNQVRAGRNYGWPVISYGVDYSGAKIGQGTAAQGMEQPSTYWDPSIAPSGLAIYQGDLLPGWRGSHFVGSLKFDQIHRLDPQAGFAEEILKSPATARVRDLREGPDGAIWFLSVGQGALYRMAPAR